MTDALPKQEYPTEFIECLLQEIASLGQANRQQIELIGNIRVQQEKLKGENALLRREIEMVGMLKCQCTSVSKGKGKEPTEDNETYLY